MSEEYSVGYSEGYQAGWNAAMDAAPPAAQPAPVQEPTCKQDLQVWVQRTGQFSWEPQDERFWTRMQPAHHTEQHLEMVANQPAPVPTSWMEMVTANLVREGVNKHKARELAEHFYTAPPAQRQWVGLTDEEITQICVGLWSGGWRETAMRNFARAIEAKLKEKNT